MNKIWKGLKKKIQDNSLIYKYYPIFRELPPQLRKKPSAYFLYKQKEVMRKLPILLKIISIFRNRFFYCF